MSFPLCEALASIRLNNSIAGRALQPGLHSTRLRSGLVVFQVAVAIVLLIGSGLLIRSLVHLTTVDLGFDPDHLLTGTIRIQSADYPTPEERNLFFNSLLEDIEAQPGVVSATLINKLTDSQRMARLAHLARQPTPSICTRQLHGHGTVGSSGYFETMKIPLLEGRDVSDTDVPGSPRVVVLSEAVVRNLFAGRIPSGRWSKSDGVTIPTKSLVSSPTLASTDFATISIRLFTWRPLKRDSHGCRSRFGLPATPAFSLDPFKPS